MLKRRDNRVCVCVCVCDIFLEYNVAWFCFAVVFIIIVVGLVIRNSFLSPFINSFFFFFFWSFGVKKHGVNIGSTFSYQNNNNNNFSSKTVLLLILVIIAFSSCWWWWWSIDNIIQLKNTIISYLTNSKK